MRGQAVKLAIFLQNPCPRSNPRLLIAVDEMASLLICVVAYFIDRRISADVTVFHLVSRAVRVGLGNEVEIYPLRSYLQFTCYHEIEKHKRRLKTCNT